MAKQPRAIGIDLGTTNSCAAVMDGGRPRVITYKGGGSTIPSVFAIDEHGNQLVGVDAKRQAQLNPQNTVMASKRLIGRNFHSKTIENVKQVFTYEMLEGENNEVLVKVKGEVFTLEQISAAILSKIKDVTEDALQEPVQQAVITVPAYFNDRQRQAVRNAGKLAGLDVLRILNEPTAAALAYGLGKNLSQRIAVYDLGGGTFDISIIDIADRVFEVIATGGDTFLGGVDFDRRLMKHVLETFYDQHGVDLSWDRVAIQRIRDAAETAKIELSSRSTTRIQIPYVARTEAGPIDIDMEITRALLESLTRDLVERTLATCERIFSHAGTTKADIQEVLLVGGQSRMPLVQQQVAAFMGKAPSKGVHPDEAVGIGAAIMAHSLSGGSAAEVSLLDVLPIPIGISKVDGGMHVLFQKNERLPASKTRTLTTSKTNQRSIMLRIYQGESRMVSENELLGTFVFSKIRPANKGEVQIEVTFFIDSEGILNLTARDKETNQTVESTLKITPNKGPSSLDSAAAAAGHEPPAPALPATPPPPLKAPGSPFAMPLSSLMQDIGGEGAAAAPDLLAAPPQFDPAESAALRALNEPTLLRPQAPHGTAVASADSVAVEITSPLADAPSAAIPAPLPGYPPEPPVQQPTLWQRILAFFRIR